MLSPGGDASPLSSSPGESPKYPSFQSEPNNVLSLLLQPMRGPLSINLNRGFRSKRWRKLSRRMLSWRGSWGSWRRFIRSRCNYKTRQIAADKLFQPYQAILLYWSARSARAEGVRAASRVDSVDLRQDNAGFHGGEEEICWQDIGVAGTYYGSREEDGWEGQKPAEIAVGVRDSSRGVENSQAEEVRLPGSDIFVS